MPTVSFREDIPPTLRDLWRQFGASTSTGRLLRSIYDPSILSAKSVAYPALPANPKRALVVEKPRELCTKKSVAVPRVGVRKSVTDESNECRPSCVRPASLILKSLEAERPFNSDYKPTAGTDREEQRRQLQESFTFGRGSCLPSSVLPPQVKLSPLSTSISSLHRPASHHDKHPLEGYKDKSTVLKELFDDVRETQEKLENWGVDVIKPGRNVGASQRAINAKQLEQIELQNKIKKTLKEIRLIVQ